MRRSIVLSTRTDIIVVAKLAQYYEQQMDTRRPNSKSALIDMCLRSLLEIIKNNNMLKEDEMVIETETQAYEYLNLLGYDIASRDKSIPKDIFRSMGIESLSYIDEDIAMVKAAMKADKDSG